MGVTVWRVFEKVRRVKPDRYAARYFRFRAFSGDLSAEVRFSLI